MNITTSSDIRSLAKRIRKHSLRMTSTAGSSHIGTCLSMADILAVLYGSILKINPNNADDSARDRFILSKGHGAAAAYAVLAECGFIKISDLDGINEMDY